VAEALEGALQQAGSVLELSNPVRAAGGLVRRGEPDGGVRYALVHRPRYDDWSFPKGKLHDGESHEAAALREVEEETGLRCELERELPSIEYRDRNGRPKVVRYWTMRPIGGSFTPNAEVDEVRWVAPDEALTLLAYDHDRELLRSVESIA
jgi:8-oxo-dGTP pyrophosphatase MutT (NUDIX family)